MHEYNSLISLFGLKFVSSPNFLVADVPFAGNGVASPTNKFFNLVFNSVANKVYLQPNLHSTATANGYLTGVIVDNDGTITGTCGNLVISGKNSILPDGCTAK